MCSSQNQNKDQKEKEPTKKLSLPGVFVFVSIIFTLSMAFLIIWPIIQRKPSVRKVEIVLQIPQDSIIASSIISHTEGQLGVIIEELNRQSHEIMDKYDLLIKSQETESDFFRLVSCIAAFVVALLGFLGYRTIKDIEANAESIASRTAKDYTKNHLERTVAMQLKDFVGDSTAAKLINQQIMNEVNTNIIAPLESRIADLENNKDLNVKNMQAEHPAERTFEQLEDEMLKLNEDGGSNDE